MKIFKNILFILFALVFINAGLDKFLHYMPVPPMSAVLQKVGEAIGTIKWIIPLAGFIELVSGLLIIFPKTRTLGALMIFPVLIGILVHNATFMPEGLVIAGVLFLIEIWILVDSKEKIMQLIA